ncbi:hypothetical protein AB3N62_10810 [Leptospira sp. WS4.C2]
MKLNNKLETAIHFLWFCKIDLENVKVLKTQEYSRKHISFPKLKKNSNIDSTDYEISDRFHFPLIGSNDILLFRLIYESLEKLFKATIIVQNYLEKREKLEIKSDHSLSELWNNIPNVLEFKIENEPVFIHFKKLFDDILLMENFFTLDYNLLRYGLNKSNEVSKIFNFQISNKDLELFLNKIDTLSTLIGSGIYSSEFSIGKEPTGEKFPRVIIKNSDGNSINRKKADFVFEITNEKRNCT